MTRPTPTLTGSPRLDRALGQAAERRRDAFNAAVFAARVMARIREQEQQTHHNLRGID